MFITIEYSIVSLFLTVVFFAEVIITSYLSLQLSSVARGGRGGGEYELELKYSSRIISPHMILFHIRDV